MEYYSKKLDAWVLKIIAPQILYQKKIDYEPLKWELMHF